MKRITLLLLILLSLGFTNCMNAVPPEKAQSTVEQPTIYPFKLYPTDNMWTFIKLDTRNGKMWQVQFSVKGDDYRFETVLSSTILAEGSKAGRFELYATQNMYNFLLLDKTSGKTWQVQWSTDPDNRGIVPIY